MPSSALEWEWERNYLVELAASELPSSALEWEWERNYLVELAASALALAFARGTAVEAALMSHNCVALGDHMSRWKSVEALGVEVLDSSVDSSVAFDGVGRVLDDGHGTDRLRSWVFCAVPSAFCFQSGE